MFFFLQANWPLRITLQLHFFFLVWSFLCVQYSFMRSLACFLCSSVQALPVFFGLRAAWIPSKLFTMFRSVFLSNSWSSEILNLSISVFVSLIHFIIYLFIYLKTHNTKTMPHVHPTELTRMGARVVTSIDNTRTTQNKEKQKNKIKNILDHHQQYSDLINNSQLRIHNK